MSKPAVKGRAGGKTSMRTAEDVIKRIKWDPDTRQEDWSIGYIDRFKGIMEDPFVGFNWEDVVQHRIQYFRYRGHIVWDKRKKLDHVFGSLGGPSLSELGLDSTEETKGDDEGDEAKGDDIADTPIESEASQQTHIPRYPPPVIRVGDRPNYFICLRITAPQLIGKMEEMQQVFTALDPRLAPGVLPKESFHITLAAIQLKNAMEHERAVSLMRRCGEVLRTVASQAKPIKFQGVHCFRDRVIYANPVDSEGFLSDLQEQIQDIFEGEGTQTC